MTKILRCAIIEDEPLAQELLEKYVRRVASLELAGTFDDAIAAFDQLPALGADVIFLDINMPEMTGIEFLKASPGLKSAVILTTANPDHALDGFDLGVADYLLKPITFERFLKAIGRVREKMSGHLAVEEPAQVDDKSLSHGSSGAPVADYLFFKTDRKLEQVRFEEIMYAESLGDYIKIYLPDRFLVTHLTMKKLGDSLPADRFIRVSRSYIIQLRYVKTLEGNTIVTTGGRELVIGPSYREEVRATLQKWMVD